MSDGSSDAYQLMRELREKRLHFELASYSDDCIMLIVSVPGERWEIEVFSDGHRTLERYVSQGAGPAGDLSALIAEFGDA